ncbi:MAG: DUF1585 domain-containing protein, partial [Bryobacteraceae bacterium]
MYALGRGLSPYDMPMIRKIVRDSARDDYRFSSIVMGITESAAFQMERTPEAAPLPSRDREETASALPSRDREEAGSNF